MDVIGREESRVIKLKTVQRWVTDSRNLRLLPPSKRVSVKKINTERSTKRKKGQG